MKLKEESCFGHYQHLIQKNAYIVGEGSFCSHLDEVLYLCGRQIVLYELMKKKQNFIMRYMEDGDVTAMNFFSHTKSAGGQVLLIATALKTQQNMLPTVRIYQRVSAPIHIVLSKVDNIGSNRNIISCCFIHKGKYIAILVEIEPRALYVLAVCLVASNTETILKEDLQGHYTKIDACMTDNSVFTVSSDKGIRVYQLDPKANAAGLHTEKTKQVNAGIVLDTDYIIDHCWLSKENKLVVITQHRIFTFDNSSFECSINFEFPAIELKDLVKDRLDSEKQTKAEGGDVSKSGIYYSLEYLISYLNPSGGDLNAKEMPDYLSFVVESELKDKFNGSKLRDLRDEARRGLFKSIYMQQAKKVLAERGIEMSCVCKQENGFAVGFKGIGMVAVYKRKKDSYTIDSCSVIRNKNADIWSMSSAQDDNCVVLTVAVYKMRVEDRIKQLSLGNVIKHDSIELVNFNSSLVNTIKNSSMEPFEFLYPHGSHSSAVLKAAVIPTKSILGTVSRDKTFKLWQYNGDHKQLMSFEPNSFDFSNNICMDMHPLGMQVAIATKDCLKIYYMVEGDMTPAYENYNKNFCTALAYSSRGQYLAAAFHLDVWIIDPYSFELIHTVKGSADGVKSLTWTARDRYLVTLCNNTYFSITDSWQQFSVKVDDSKLSKSMGKLTAIAYDAEFDLLVCCCPDAFVRIFSCAKGEIYTEINNSLNPMVFTSVLISKRFQVIFFGTQSGVILVYLWPFMDQKKPGVDAPFPYPIHLQAITSISITPNCEHLVTTSEDGSIYFMKITERERGNDKNASDNMGKLVENKDAELISCITNAFSLNEFTCMSTFKQKELIKKMGELESALTTKMHEIDTENENLAQKYKEELDKKEKENQEKLRQMNKELAEKMDKVGLEQKALEQSCNQERDKLKNTVREKELNHRTKLMDLYQTRDEIEDKMRAFEEEKDREILESQRRFEMLIEKLKNEYEKNKQQVNTQYGQAIFYLKEDQKKFQTALRQTEDEYGTLIDETKTKLTDVLTAKKNLTEQIRTKQTKLVKDSLKYSERIENLDKLITETKSQNEQLLKDIESFNQKYKEMEARLNEQEKVINDKEVKIKEYRNKNYHLQNFKSVYDYQVTTLKEEHEPLTEYVDNLEVVVHNPETHQDYVY